jgi:hypothetical protein
MAGIDLGDLVLAIGYAARIHSATAIRLRCCQIPNADSDRDQHGRERELMHFAPFLLE